MLNIPVEPAPPNSGRHVCRDAGEAAMDETVVRDLQTLAEPIAVLSVAHLSPATRRLIRQQALSVNVYTTPGGGFVYVGAPRYDTPLEPDLARIFEAAERAGVVWLKFDEHAPVVDGLPTFWEAPESS